MVWKKRVLLLPLVLALVGYANISYGQQAEGAQDISPSMRLLYWYDPHNIEQVNQLEALRLLVQEGRLLLLSGVFSLHSFQVPQSILNRYCPIF